MGIATKYFMLKFVKGKGTSFEYPFYLYIFASQEVQRNDDNSIFFFHSFSEYVILTSHRL